MPIEKQVRPLPSASGGDWPEIPKLFKESEKQDAFERWWFDVKEKLDAKVAALEALAKAGS